MEDFTVKIYKEQDKRLFRPVLLVKILCHFPVRRVDLLLQLPGGEAQHAGAEGAELHQGAGEKRVLRICRSLDIKSTIQNHMLSMMCVEFTFTA